MPQMRHGQFGLPWTLWSGNLGIFVYNQTIVGLEYYVAVRLRAVGNFVLIDYGVDVPGRVINSALAEADTTGLGAVKVCGADYPLEISVAFPANELTLEGSGRITFLDGDALATNVHAIVLSGYDDCVIRDLSVQTEDGGGKTCQCIFIEDGADRFTVEGVTIVNSDMWGIYINGTSINGGLINNVTVLDADDRGIYCIMDAANFMYDLIMSNCSMSGRQIMLYNCYRALIQTNNVAQFYLRDCYACVVDGNVVLESEFNGISIWGSNFAVITNNTVFLSRGHGIYIRESEDSVIDGNVVYDAGQGSLGNNDGIYVVADDRTIVSNNHVSGPGDSTRNGINIQETNYCVVVGNICYNGMGDGISVGADSSYNIIKGNQCVDNDGYGIQITNVDCVENVVDANNVLEGNILGAVDDGGTDTRWPELSATVVAPNGNVGLHPAIVLTDGVPVYGTIEFIAPSNMQELVSAGVVLVAAGTGNLRRWVISDYGRRCHDEVYNLHEGSIDTATVAVTINELECIDVTAALANLGAYDVVALQFGRAGQDALDTIDADCYLLGLYMEYV